jgi:hypothetical protein
VTSTIAEDTPPTSATKFSHSPPHGAAPQEQDRVAGVLRDLDLPSIAASDQQLALALAGWSPLASRLLQDEEVDRSIEDQIVALASTLDRQSGVAGDDSATEVSRGPTRLASSVMPPSGCAVARKIRCWSGDSPASWYGSWPHAPRRESSGGSALERLVRELPYEVAAPLWPVLLQLRSRADV